MDRTRQRGSAWTLLRPGSGQVGHGHTEASRVAVPRPPFSLPVMAKLRRLGLERSADNDTQK